MAGYSGTPLAKKLGIKPGMSASVINAPRPYESLLGRSTLGTTFADEGSVDFLHYFVTSAKELKSNFPKLKRRIKKEGLLWISWPKGSSHLETDLNGDVVREIGLSCGLVDTKVCAVDEDWSGLKFVYRLKDR